MSINYKNIIIKSMDKSCVIDNQGNFSEYQQVESEPEKSKTFIDSETKHSISDSYIVATSVYQDIINTIEHFKQPSNKLLMNTFLTDTTTFINFIDYLFEGDFKTLRFKRQLTYPTELLNNIRNTFEFFKDYDDETLTKLLNNYSGNLNLVLKKIFTSHL